MTTAAPTPTVTGRHPLRAAFEDRDRAGIAAALAPGVVLRSPITSRFAFEGRDEVAAVLAEVRGLLDDLHYSADYGDGERHTIVFGARVEGHELEGTDALVLDDDGAVREVTVFVRPLTGLTALLAALAPRLARRRGRVAALAVSALVGPLALLTRLGDGPVSRIVRGAGAG